MKRFPSLAVPAVVTLLLGALAMSAAQAGLFDSKNKKSNSRDKFEDSADLGDADATAKIPLVGEYTTVYGQELIKLQGAGLVTGLDGTGEDPPPSLVRQMVIEEMKRRRIPHPNDILKSPNIAIVLVTAYVPPLIRNGDTFDVEVIVPDGSKVKSLNGGWLLPTFLSEQAYIPGNGVHHGPELVIAKGPILISAAHEKNVLGLLRRGTIVSGGTWVSKTDRNLSLLLRSGFRSERNAVRIASAIGRRFFDHDKYGVQMPLAEAKTNQKIELKVPARYRDNYPRYLDVIRRIAFRESELGRQVRIATLKGELLNGDTASEAALRLEAIGDEAIPTLKAGIKNGDAEVRFHSAVALAYLGDASGLDALAQAAREEYAFRIFAFAAMSCLEDPEVPAQLRKLMSADSAETRYGAFRAMTTLDKNDPFVRGQKINDFQLHVLATSGPPMVHITNRKKAEIVIFGADQPVLTPIAARAGTRIMINAAQGNDRVTVTRFDLGHDEQRKVVPARLSDVVLAITDFGATFPDVAQFLAEADAQKNLAGRFEIDALPQAGRYYERHRSELANKAARSKQRVGNSNSAPNLFTTEADRMSRDKKQGEARDDERDKSDKEPDGSPRPKAGAQKGSGDAGGTAVTADYKTDSADSAESGSAGVTPASHQQPDAPAAKSSVASNSDSPSESTASSSSSGGFFNFFRFFDFGNHAPSGNKEP